MGNFEDLFGDLFGDIFQGYKNTSRYKDDSMMEIIYRKKEFEENLNEMWKIYTSGNFAQITEYQKGVEQIKETGLKVMRNSAGEHKIIVPK